MNRKKSDKISPVASRQSSRMPGESLRNEMELVSGELFYFIGAGFALVVLGVLGIVLHLLSIDTLLYLSVQILCGFTLAIFGIRQWYKKDKPLRLGHAGERAVAETLRELERLGWRVIHDVPSGRKGMEANIDHVLVGPAGVFAIETKTASKAKNEKICFNGQVLQFAGGWVTSDPLSQAAACAKDVTDVLLAEVGEVTQVKPVVIYPGWWIEYTDGYAADHPVWVMTDKYFVKVLRDLGKDRPNLSREQVASYAQGLVRHSDGVRRHQ